MSKRYLLFFLLFAVLGGALLVIDTLVLQVVLGIFFGLAVVGFINCTPLFYRGPSLKESDNPILMDPRAASVLRQNGNKKAVLLVHGFSSNPWLFHKHIPLFEQAGYDVIAPRLPGHGTSPEEFLQSSFTQYYQCVEDTLKQYRSQYEHFHVIGISMGGLLTLKLGTEHSSGQYAPTSMTTLAAPVSFKDPRLFVLRMLSWVKPRLTGTWDPKERESDGAECWLGYNDLFLPQTYSIAMAAGEVQDNLEDITLPHLLIHAKGDKDVPFENVYKIASATSSLEQEIWVPNLSEWNHSQHSLFLYDSLRDPLFQRILEFVATKER